MSAPLARRLVGRDEWTGLAFGICGIAIICVALWHSRPRSQSREVILADSITQLSLLAERMNFLVPYEGAVVIEASIKRGHPFTMYLSHVRHGAEAKTNGFSPVSEFTAKRATHYRREAALQPGEYQLTVMKSPSGDNLESVVPVRITVRLHLPPPRSVRTAGVKIQPGR